MKGYETMQTISHNLIGDRVMDLKRSKRGEIRGTTMVDTELFLLVAWVIEETTERTEYKLSFESMENVVLIRED